MPSVEAGRSVAVVLSLGRFLTRAHVLSPHYRLTTVASEHGHYGKPEAHQMGRTVEPFLIDIYFQILCFRKLFCSRTELLLLLLVVCVLRFFPFLLSVFVHSRSGFVTNQSINRSAWARHEHCAWANAHWIFGMRRPLARLLRAAAAVPSNALVTWQLLWATCFRTRTPSCIR